MRTRGARLSVALGALAVGALTAGLAAGAGSGLRYAAETGTVASGTNLAAARCPGSTTVVGGGVGVNDDGPDTEINSTAPGGGGWVAWINNSTSGDVRFVVTAICAESGQYERVRRTRTIPPDTTELDQVRCPAGTKVTGGGVDTNPPANDVEIVSSFPLDTGDPNRRPEDGWRGKVNNELDTNAQMTVVAICAERGRYGYVSSVRDLPVDTERRVRATCGAPSKVTGGGVSMQGLDFGFEASNSFPQDRGDGDERPDDGWVAGGNNEGELGHDTELRAWAICKRPG